MWRRIPAEAFYEAHPCGRIREIGSTQDLRYSVDKRGYRRVHLFGVRNPQFVHRLIAKTFLPNPQNLSDVAHLDGKPGRDQVENLMWMSHQDNQKMMRQHGTQWVPAKLTAAEVAEIREKHTAGKRGIGKILAAEYGVSNRTISKIIHNQRWIHNW